MLSLFALAAATPTPGLKPFEFQGIVAGSPAVATDWCPQSEIEKGKCARYSVQIAGVSGYAAFTFHRGAVSTLNGGVRHSGFGELLAALVAKYGQPTTRATQKWKSRGGVTLDNMVLTWKFSSGTLEVREYGSSLDWSQLQYLDVNKAPPEPAKVDF